MDLVSGPYTESETVVMTGSFPRSDTVIVDGLVQGTSVTVPRESLTETVVHPSTLTLTLLQTTPETVTAQIELTDAQTGTPIQTTKRDGAVLLQGRSIETDEAGMATVTIPRPVGALSARYEPAAWWRTEQGFLPSSDTVYIRGTTIPIVATVFNLGVPVGTFLFAVFLIARATGWDIWPLWGRR